MFKLILELIADCRALAAQVVALRTENVNLKVELASASQGKAEAEAAAQALKDELTAALSGFTPSGN